MEFTPQEQKMVERMRKRQAKWRQFKWWSLGSGLIHVAVGFGILILLDSFGREEDLQIKALMYAFYLPSVFFMIGIGTHTIVTTIRDWHGNAQDSLILKLIDRSETDWQNNRRK